MQALGPRAVGEVLDDAGGLAAADAEGVDELVLGQSVEPARRRGGREAAGERGGVVVARVEAAGHREADPAHHLHARDHRLERGAAGGLRRLAHRQRGGHRHAAGVDDGVLARVVEIEPVGQRAVGEHGGGGARPAPCCRSPRSPAAPPSRPAASVTARPNACREDARQLPRVSSASSVACAETAGGHRVEREAGHESREAPSDREGRGGGLWHGRRLVLLNGSGDVNDELARARQGGGGRLASAL